MEAKYCYGCMKPRAQSPICPHCGWDARRENAAHQLPVGTVLQGKYLIGRALGQGGFGITYLGRDLDLNIPVAIKEYYPNGIVMRESIHSLSVSAATGDGNDSFTQNRARFLREAQTLARLERVPEVVQVKSFFSQNNTAYIVMGYVEGITLKEYVRRQGDSMTPDGLFRLLRPVMEAMDKVHALNLVHRDISPDNIMITPDGQARLIDFGAAHEATGEDDKSTQAVLKHGYAPVEQYQYKGKLGSWTDVYSMCATIYRCLAHRQPPNATDRLMFADDFDWDCVPGLTAAQKAVLTRGLALNPLERISSMGELSRLLLSPGAVPVAPPAQGNAPAPRPKQPERVTEALPGTVAPDLPKKGKSFPLLLVLGGAALLALVILAALLLWEPDQHAQPDDYLETQPSQSTPAAIPTASTGISNILMEQPVENSGTAGVQPAFHTAARRNQIRSITVLDSVSTAPAEAVDVSQLCDGSVLAWVVPNGSLYDLYLAAEGGIIAPENCSGLFAGYSRLESVDFGGAFYTPSTRDMSGMFRDCVSLTDLDISDWNTASVTDTSYMFAGSTALTNVTGSFHGETVTSYEGFMDTDDLYNGQPWKKLYLGDMILMEHYVEREHITSAHPAFRTEARRNQVVSITILPTTADAPKNAVDASYYQDGSVLAWVIRNGSYYDLYLAAEGGITAPADSGSLFRGFTRVQEIRFNNAFDTSKVENMRGFFSNCQSLTEVDLSCFDTGNATNMAEMFAHCYKLTSLDLSTFDTSQVTDMSSMFQRTDRLANLNANLELGSVKSYSNFMDDRDTYNGESWKTLFE